MTEPTNLWDKADVEIAALRQMVSEQEALIDALRMQIERDSETIRVLAAALADAQGACVGYWPNEPESKPALKRKSVQRGESPRAFTQRKITSLHDVVMYVCDKHDIATFVPGCPECRSEAIAREALL